MPMKDLFCSSQSSTSICSSIDQHSMVRNGIKPLTRLDSKLYDHYKTIPCISELPLTPRPSSHRYKTQKLGSVSRRKSSADVSDLRYTNSGHSSRYLLGDSDKALALVPSKELRKSKSEKGRLGSTDKEKKAGPLTLLNNNNGDQQMIIKANYGDYVYNNQKSTMGQIKDFDSRVFKSSTSPRARARARDQVVVLRISLNCKCRGCEAKLRKHLSKMEGVTSFSIDLEIKKVTVVGNVTPLDVLTSISKVKSAQFWPSPASTSSSTSSSSTSSTSDLNF